MAFRKGTKVDVACCLSLCDDDEKEDHQDLPVELEEADTGLDWDPRVGASQTSKASISSSGSYVGRSL